jgi:hypothetical protein
MMERKDEMLSTISDRTSEGRINCLTVKCLESNAAMPEPEPHQGGHLSPPAPSRLP